MKLKRTMSALALGVVCALVGSGTLLYLVLSWWLILG